MQARDDLRKEIAQLLNRRPGWTLQAVPTPGAPPVWCFGSERAIELSVTTDNGSIDMYVVDLNENMFFGTTGQLAAWLKTHKAEAMQDPKVDPIQRPGRRRFFRWE
jgi:hypothetical protein